MQHAFAWKVIKKPNESGNAQNNYVGASGIQTRNFDKADMRRKGNRHEELCSLAEELHSKDFEKPNEFDSTETTSINKTCFPYVDIAFSNMYNRNPTVYKCVAFADEVCTSETTASITSSKTRGETPQEYSQSSHEQDGSSCDCDLCALETCTVENCEQCEIIRSNKNYNKTYYDEAKINKRKKIKSIQKCSSWIENGRFDADNNNSKLEEVNKTSILRNSTSTKSNSNRQRQMRKKTRFEVNTSKQNTNTTRFMKAVTRCFRCLLNRRDSGSSDSGGSGSGDGDEGDGDGEGDNYAEHGDEVSGGNDSDGGDSGSDTGDDGSLNSAELFDDQQNQFDVKDALGEFESDGGGGSAASEVTDSLTELGTEEAEEEANSSDDDDDDDPDDDVGDDENSWQSIIIYERE